MAEFMCNHCASLVPVENCTTIIKATQQILRFCPACVIASYRKELNPVDRAANYRAHLENFYSKEKFT